MIRSRTATLQGLVLLSVASACVKKQDGADTQSAGRRTPVPTPSLPAGGKSTPPPYRACEDTQNTFTTVDTWTVRYNSTWASNVIITLSDATNPTSLVFTHPTKELARKQIIEDGCFDSAKDDTLVDKSYPVIGGVNLFNKSAPACPGGKSLESDYRYVFVQRDKKYIAVSKGADGCSEAKLSTPGNCYLWGVVEGTHVYLHNNACLAGYNIFSKTGGVAQKLACGTGATKNVVGESYPAGFILIHEPFPGWAKTTGDCKAPPTPGTPLPPRDPTPFKTITPSPDATKGSTPPPTGTMPPGGVTPGGKIPTPAPTTPSQPPALPPVAQPTPPCDPWVKGSCFDGFDNPSAPPPNQQQQVPPPSDPTPIPTQDRPIWYKK